MATDSARAGEWVFHPFLLVLYLVGGLLAENLGEARIADAGPALGCLLAGTAVLFALLARRRTASEAGLLCSLALVLSFGHGWVFGAWVGGETGNALYVALAVEVALGVGGAVLLARMRERHAAKQRAVSRGLDLVVGALCVLVGVEVALYHAREDADAARGEATRAVLPIPLPDGAADAPKPDIYYVVLDAYTRSDTLRAFYNGNNGKLRAFLGERGFAIAPLARTNYLSTKLVLPAVFNLEYLDDVAARVGRESMDVRPLRAATERNRIVETLRGIGYRIVHINSGPDYVTFADPDVALEAPAGVFGLSEFSAVLAGMTPLPALFDRFGAGADASPAGVHRRRVEYALEALAEQAAAPGPKFVVAHIFAPHDPIVFGRHGEMRSVWVRLFHDYTRPQQQFLMAAYRDEVAYLDGLVVDTLGRLLDASKTPPVVVVQGDHGLRLFLARRAEQSCLRESFSILNALHLPGVDLGALPATLSPVNTFRLILDAYFGAELGLLEDRAYFSHRFGLYDFVDVSAEAETCTTMGQIPPPT